MLQTMLSKQLIHSISSQKASACRCLVLCKALGIFGTAHSDGKLYLRLLPNLQAGEGQTVTVGDPVKAAPVDRTALIQVQLQTMLAYT